MNAYEALTKISESNPDLIFNNDGYQNLKPEIVEANKDAIKSVEAILCQCVKGFVSFQNFKTRPDGSMVARYQVWYNDEGSFTGVAYTDLRDFETIQVKDTV